MWVGVLSLLTLVAAAKAPESKNPFSDYEDHSKPFVQLERCDRSEYFDRGFVLGRDTEYKSEWDGGYQLRLDPSFSSPLIQKLNLWIFDSEMPKVVSFQGEYLSWPIDQLIAVLYDDFVSECHFCFGYAELSFEGGRRETQCAWFTQAPRHGVTVGNGLDGNLVSASSGFSSEDAGSGGSNNRGKFGSDSGDGGICGTLRLSDSSQHSVGLISLVILVLVSVVSLRSRPKSLGCNRIAKFK